MGHAERHHHTSPCRATYDLRKIPALYLEEEEEESQQVPDSAYKQSQAAYPLPVYLHAEVLESVDCARYLGVSIPKDLSWTTY